MRACEVLGVGALGRSGGDWEFIDPATPRAGVRATHRAPRAAGEPASCGVDEYFLTCLLLVNVGMACKDLVLSRKALAGARDGGPRPPPARRPRHRRRRAAAAGVRRLTAAPGAPCVSLAALSDIERHRMDRHACVRCDHGLHTFPGDHRLLISIGTERAP